MRLNSARQPPSNALMMARNLTRRTTLLPMVALLLVAPPGALAIGQAHFVENTPSEGSFPITRGGIATSVYVDANDWPGVVRAAGDLCLDVTRVSGIAPKLVHDEKSTGNTTIVVGTIGRSAIIDQLIRDKKIDATDLTGKWEASLVQVVTKPLPGVESALVIVGSDKRGTIYGIYDLSEQLGVSPWYWWADVPVKKHETLFVQAGRHVLGPPAVKYRGIFLNDEAPALQGWAREKFGGLNHKCYTNIFELILRLKGNFLWPAMWDNSFATDDPLNAKLADEYGIVISTSHHEPMMRAWKEWSRAGNRPGTWDYSKTPEKLREFWAEGLRRTKDYEKVITLAMRGDGDEPMSETDSVALLERIVADQRKQITEIINPDLKAVPQVWALYKEVQGYYERGMRVPDDVTLLWCDDNWGNIRRLPTAEERKRSGGAGVYYHFDYVGGPRNYKWLNVTPIPKIWEQMHLAYELGADRIWIVNVGDLKPMEVPIEFFLTMAWNPKALTKERMADYLRLWATREFGPEHAADIADIVAKYTKYNRRRTPELLAPGTFSLANYQEADRIVAEWKAINDKAEAISAQLPENARDAFFQLVLHPAKGGYIVNELYVAAAKNKLYAGQGRASANDFAARVKELFKADQELSDYYNRTLTGGKWSHMMDQTHIGYSNWQQPSRNVMPAVTEIEVPDAAAMGVAVEGSASAWPGDTNEAVLSFDAFNQPKRFIAVFNKGKPPFEFKASVSAPWITLDSTSGKVDKKQRVSVTVDWSKAPKDSASGTVTITGADTEVVVNVIALNPSTLTRDSLKGFVEADGYVSIEAAHFTKKHDTASAKWEEIPDSGRTLSGMSIFPVTTASVTPSENSPCLEYQTYLFNTGKVEVTSILAPCLTYNPDRPVRLGVSFDDEAPQILTVVPKGYVVGDGNRDWEESVRNSARYVKSTHTITQPGYHTLKIWMVDPSVPVQKLLINTGGLKPSYLGPPESYRGGVASTR
ncbi:MAG: glycosyl hydrolase 115 family protein [Verrucomicrobiota bacterium]